MSVLDQQERFGMDKETRGKFGKFIEESKKAEGRGDYSYQELIQKAHEFLGGG